jgi:hypothetical protein
MAFYVVETDLPCTICRDRHGVATKGCRLVVWVDWPSAKLAAAKSEGIVREIAELPRDVPTVLFTHKNGRPDPRLPRTIARI